MSELEEQIKVVARVRAEALGIAERKVVQYQKWVDGNQILIDLDIAAKATCLAEEALLRDLTLIAYTETGNKAPAKGVGIREVTKLEYDQKVAYDWAVKHQMALKLDVTGFEKIAKVSPPEFVTVSTEPQATIAKELQVEV